MPYDMPLLKKAYSYLRGLAACYSTTGGFHDEEADLLEKYYTAPPSGREPKTEVVAMVDGRAQAGGLSDRLRGIVSLYTYCKRNGLPFRIHYTYPFRLETYLEPAIYDWTVDEKELSFCPTEACPVLLQCLTLPNKHHLRYLNRLVKTHEGKQLHVYTNTQMLDNTFHDNFAELFQPSEALRNAIDTAAANLSSPRYIAMTFRFQQLLGDFREEGYEVLNEKEQKAIIEKCIRKVEEIRTKHHPDSLVLMTSDSNKWLNAAKGRLDYVMTIPGEVVHIDYTPNASFDIYAKTFIDQFLLARAEKLYMLHTGLMYRSGFGKRAARMGGIPYEEVSF